ncbi:MAG: hypothetical protein K6L76_12660 [Agarilytica sp.]
MTDEIVNPTSKQDVAKKKGLSPKSNFLLIVAVAFVPMLLAYTMFFTGLGVPEGTVNNGELIKAQSLEGFVSDEIWQALQQKKKWRLLLPVGKTCDQSCQDSLFTTRQVHIRLGEKGIRVERYALNYGGESGAKFLDDIALEHPRLQRADVTRAQWREWSAPLEAFTVNQAKHFYFLVDQEGFAMMVYTDQHGNDLLKDIKRALKYSIDYQ